MKTPDTSRLDNYIRETLKTPEQNLPVVDWSEVDVLLKHETKSIALPDKKYLFIGAGGVVFIIGIFFLVKLIASRTSSSEKEIISADTISSIMPKDDTVALTSSVSPAPHDTIKIADTASKTANVVSPVDSSSIKIAEVKTSEKKNTEQKAVVAEQKKPEKKNSKISSLAPTISDAALTPENIIPPDTAGKNKPEPIKINSAAPADSSKVLPEKKNKKNKKGKSSADSSKVKTQTPPVKSDSLK